MYLMAKTKMDLAQTRGQFVLKGVVTRTESDNFFKTITTKTGKEMRLVQFGVNTQPDSTIYIDLNGMPQENVWFSKSEKDESGKRKNVTKQIPWQDRFTFKEDGYNMIGVHLGIEKVLDKDGKEVNNKKVLHSFDACQAIANNLKDDVSVFVRGNIEFGSYERNGETKHSTKFVPNQISLCKPVDFENPDFTPTADFKQRIVFMGIKPNEEQKKYIVSAKIVNYDSVEDTEFVIDRPELAKMFKKHLKPYTSIDVSGFIRVEKEVEEVVTEEDYWGERNSMTRINGSTTRELVITGADPTTIDKEEYSEEKMDKALEMLRQDKQSNDDWGSSNNLSSDDDDELDALW